MAKNKDLRREVQVAKIQTLIDAVLALDANTDEIEAKLQEMIVLLTSLDGKDYATETTLAALEVTANAIEVLLTSVDGKVATEATLDLIRLQTDKFTFTGGDLNVNASVSIPAGLATEVTLAGIKAQTDLLNFTGDKLRTTGEDGGGGGAGSIPTYGARIQITVDDTGTINIPANASRVALRFSNDDGEECYFSFDGTTPVWKEDIQLKKKVSFVFLVAELGKGAINFVTNNGKTTLITYQEGI